jgi:hypothetical protein
MTASEKPDYNSKDLRLHRKYILVLCFVLCILKYGGVKLNQVNLLGTSFSFDNNSAIFLGLWIILFYSIFRYYQYFRHESWGHLQSEFREVRSRFYEPKFLAMVSKEVYPKILEVQAQRKRRRPAHAPSYFHGQRVGLLTRRFTSQVAVVETEEQVDTDVVGQHVNFKYSVVRHFPIQTCAASWHFVIHTPFFFEFLFPFCLLLSTLIYCGFTNWEGSLIMTLKKL